jgi:hypothetical protein
MVLAGPNSHGEEFNILFAKNGEHHNQIYIVYTNAMISLKNMTISDRSFSSSCSTVSFVCQKLIVERITSFQIEGQ